MPYEGNEIVLGIGALIGGILATTMGSITLYLVVAQGVRVRQRPNGIYWSFAHSFELAAAILCGGISLLIFGLWWLWPNKPS